MPSAIVPKVSRSVSARSGIVTFPAGVVVTDPGLVFLAVNSGIPYELPVPEEA